MKDHNSLELNISSIIFWSTTLTLGIITLVYGIELYQNTVPVFLQEIERGLEQLVYNSTAFH